MRRSIPFVLAATALLVSAMPTTAIPPKGEENFGCKGQSTWIDSTSEYWVPGVDGTSSGDGKICLTISSTGTVTLKDNPALRKK